MINRQDAMALSCARILCVPLRLSVLAVKQNSFYEEFLNSIKPLPI